MPTPLGVKALLRQVTRYPHFSSICMTSDQKAKTITLTVVGLETARQVFRNVGTAEKAQQSTFSAHTATARF